MMFNDLIGKSIEVYVDDMLVKFKMVEDHAEHLKQMFNILRMYQMKLNPLKYAFGVGSSKFLGFMVNQCGIEANPEKIKSLLEMSSPKKPNVLKGSKRFEWTDKCEQAFQALKKHLKRPPLLSKPIEKEKLYLYLAIFEKAVSTDLVKEEEKSSGPSIM